MCLCLHQERYAHADVSQGIVERRNCLNHRFRNYILGDIFVVECQCWLYEVSCQDVSLVQCVYSAVGVHYAAAEDGQSCVWYCTQRIKINLLRPAEQTDVCCVYFI